MTIEPLFFIKTFISKSLFGRDSFVIGPSKVTKEFEENTTSSTVYKLVDNANEKIGSLIKLSKPIPVYIIILVSDDYYEININVSSISIFNLCKDIVISQDEEYLKLIRSYLYGDTDLIPKKAITNGA